MDAKLQVLFSIFSLCLLRRAINYNSTKNTRTDWYNRVENTRHPPDDVTRPIVVEIGSREDDPTRAKTTLNKKQHTRV